MDCDETIPCALFVSTAADMQPDEIIKMVIEDENDSQSFEIEKDISAFPWHVNTKYYDADIHLCMLRTKILGSREFASSVQAIILYFDGHQSNGLELVESWLPFLNEYGAEVKILLCSHCMDSAEDEGVSKLAAQEWCVKKGFELVELYPEIDAEWEAEQDFLETTGIQRVVQALHAHVWPNLVMKARTEPTNFNGLLHGGVPQNEERLNQGLEDLNLGPGLDPANIEAKIEELFGSGESDVDFAALFGQLQEMKDRVQALPSDQRKACAEQVVLAFWKAIGGDMEEVEMPEDDEPM